MAGPHRTSLAAEAEAQRAWRVRPGCAPLDAPDRLLAHEFAPPRAIALGQWEALQRLVAFCAAQVPYYRSLFRRIGLSPAALRAPDDLRRLPMLTKTEVQARADDLRSEHLPPGQRAAGISATSGSTGQPVTVHQSSASVRMFSLLKQREYRWFRWDPLAVQAALRPARDLPPGAAGQPIDLGERCGLGRWHRIDPQLLTGPFHGFQRANPIEAQKQFLAEVRPAYLIAQPADLEHLALAYQREAPPDSLRGLLGVAQELTEGMRAIIETSLGVPLHQNYGLNEVGLVACRCPEAGRYHVHAEHCLVEIVDEDDRPCRPGERGRLLVTALNNAAMPLLRYDTDDLAEAVEGPCPCGRTLPSFGRILGRYRRTVGLPPGSFERVIAVQHALKDMPPEIGGDLRQYQLHQYREGPWELRVVSAAPLPEAFDERLQRAWAEMRIGSPALLRIRRVAEIPRPPGGKFQDFTSDYMPERGAPPEVSPAGPGDPGS